MRNVPPRSYVQYFLPPHSVPLRSRSFLGRIAANLDPSRITLRKGPLEWPISTSETSRLHSMRLVS